MNPSINNCLDHIDGNDSLYESLVAEGESLKNNISQWNWSVTNDKEQGLALLQSLLHLNLLALVTGDEEMGKLKITALGQLGQVNISESLREEFVEGLEQRAVMHAVEILKCFDKEGTAELLPSDEKRPSNVLCFERAQQTFIDSYYAMAAHSGFEDDSQSPIPAIDVAGGYLLSCAFPDPKNFCRLWFELRKGDEIVSDVIGDFMVAGQSLSLKSGECAVLITSEELAWLLEGELEMSFDRCS